MKRTLFFSFLSSGLIVLFLLSNVFILKSQTWIYTTQFDNTNGQTVTHNPQYIGPSEMCKTPDGSIFSIVTTRQDGKQHLIKVNSNGNFVCDNSLTGNWETSFGLKPTADNGCVAIVWHLNPPNVFSNTIKFSAGGFIEWMKSDFQPNLSYSILPTPFNTYYINYRDQDSLVEVNAQGNYIRHRPSHFADFETMNDSDLIVFSSADISRQGFNGNITWTDTGGSYKAIYVDTNIIYCRKGNLVKKIKTSDGSLLWMKNINYGFLSITHDSGLIASSGPVQNEIARFDSSGNQTLSRIIPFPDYGYKSIIEQSSNSFVTGGAYLCAFLDYFTLGHGYSYFMMSLDSTAHGVVDSTNHYFTGNANDTGAMSFADDASFIAAALGNSGIARPNALRNWWQSIAVFGTDWTGRFPTGLNYKFSDFDGNGVINAADVTQLSNVGPYLGGPPSHWRLSNFNPAVPDLNLSIEEDTVIAGDSITIYISIGSASVVVDSIYSISMTINFPGSYPPLTCRKILPVSGFGDPAFNLFNYFSESNSVPFPAINYVISRTDQINAFLDGDTISIIRIPISTQIPSGRKFAFANFHAITKGGYDVQLNLISDSVFLFNTILDVKETNESSFAIYPNPTSGIINVNSNDETIDQLLIYNSVGELLIKKNNLEKNYILNIDDLPNGCYHIHCYTSRNVYHFKVLLSRK